VTASAPGASGTAMKPAEIEAFLRSQRTLVLVTLRPDGSPVAHPLWFTKLGDALYVNTREDSLKRRNVARDARVCAVVEGRCTPVADPEEIARVEKAEAEKSARIGSGLGELPEWFSQSRARRRERGDRVLLRIAMERVFSWDFARLRRHYAAAAQDGKQAGRS
jgi:general stress protein 26